MQNMPGMVMPPKSPRDKESDKKPDETHSGHDHSTHDQHGGAQ